MPGEIEHADALSVEEAARILQVKPSTVYAYISRGLLHSDRSRGRSWLSRAAVEQFGRRKGTPPEPPSPGPEPAEATTRIAHIVDDRLLYRGRPAIELARTQSFESVAELLWGERLSGPAWVIDAKTAAAIGRLQEAMPASSLPLDRIKATTMLLGALDPFRYDLSTASVTSVARTLAPAFVESLPAGTHPAGEGRSIAERLWARLSPSAPTPADLALLSAALVLCADHGLGPSTRAARDAAATAADPYSVVLAGTSMASGLLHGGGSSLAVQAWLAEIDSRDQVARVLGQRLQRGDRLSGFGQPRYRGPDPRGALLLAMLAKSAARPERLDIVRAAVELVIERRQLHPNVEFALGALCFAHDLANGAGEAVFVIARSAGWIAHAIEKYEPQQGHGAS
ncbi:citrate synthase [Nonomuraea sp. M3C6]|uniref:citrate synthase (unknown stereospecificity) n=1 Tax=Nonomuraea marmarensis TaxID=3351344 RepID=A0ABW7AX90_9ACTN